MSHALARFQREREKREKQFSKITFAWQCIHYSVERTSIHGWTLQAASISWEFQYFFFRRGVEMSSMGFKDIDQKVHILRNEFCSPIVISTFWVHILQRQQMLNDLHEREKKICFVFGIIKIKTYWKLSEWSETNNEHIKKWIELNLPFTVEYDFIWTKQHSNERINVCVCFCAHSFLHILNSRAHFVFHLNCSLL